MPLADVLSTFCAPPVPAVVNDHPGLNAMHADLLIAALRKRSDEAGRIIEIGRQTRPLLEQVREQIEDQSRVNQLIARIDTLRAKMFELNDCYELVTQLSQRTEMARFESDRKLAASKAQGVERQRRQLTRDIANVDAVTEAAEEFQKLIDLNINKIEQQACSTGVSPVPNLPRAEAA
jgi:hypothetical protein